MAQKQNTCELLKQLREKRAAIVGEENIWMMDAE